jgi:vacuolar protein-sorting-associated protein 4
VSLGSTNLTFDRLTKLLFERAFRKKPCIIFFDEIDAMCAKRDRSADHENRVKNEFLVQIDGVDKDDSGILFIAATNLPWTMDEAFRRRFQKRIHVLMPDSAARRRLFEIEVGDTRCTLLQEDYEQLTEKTDGFSGSDITNLVQEALMGPVKRLHRATHFRRSKLFLLFSFMNFHRTNAE